ncbi:MAG: serine protease [Gemmataceae bacterium]
MRRLFSVLVFAIFACVCQNARAGGIPVDSLKKLKAASVYVKVQFAVPVPGGKSVPGTGSGFVVHTDGDTGFIVTNNHVISPPAGVPGLARVDPVILVFDSGSPKERSINAQVIVADPLADLAVLKVTGIKDLPAPIVIDPKAEIVETMTVFAFGFPFGGALSTGKRNPAITVTKGTVSSLRTDERGAVVRVQIDAEINPGNSGGPVVSEKGQLVGVAVAKIDKSRIGFAVPIKPLSDLLLGRMGGAAFETVAVADKRAKVDVEAILLDPLNKVRDAQVHLVAAKDAPKKTEPDKDGNFPLLKDAKAVALRLDKGKLLGHFTFEGKDRRMPIVYQASFTSGDGRKIVGPPTAAFIDFTQEIRDDTLTKDDPLDPALRQPRKVFERRLEAGRFYVVEMRGDAKDLDPFLRIENSEGKALVEDDNSGGLLNALIVFKPEKDGDYKLVATTRRGAGKFQFRLREENGADIGPKGFTKRDKLLSSDTLDKVVLSPSQSFNFVFQKGLRYVIDLRSKDFDAFLRLENMAGTTILFDDDSGGELNSRMIFTTPVTTIFKVVATSFDRNTGEYELSIRTMGAFDVGGGLKIMDILNDADPLDRVKKGKVKVAEVNLQAGQRYQIDLISSQFDAFLRIEDAKGKELANDDNSGGGQNARITFTPPADGVYRLFATTNDGRLGQFLLLVRKI